MKKSKPSWSDTPYVVPKSNDEILMEKLNDLISRNAVLEFFDRDEHIVGKIASIETGKWTEGSSLYFKLENGDVYPARFAHEAKPGWEDRIGAPNLRKIPQFIHVDGGFNVSWDMLEWQLGRFEEGYGLELDPDFQRAHVWSTEKQIAYVEFILRGGSSAREILWNCPCWGGRSDGKHPVVLVDGKQRLQAARLFLANEIPAFGYRLNQYIGSIDSLRHQFIFKINALQTRAEVLQWYIDYNSGGVVHTDDELDKVRKLLEEEKSNVG